MSKYNHTKRRNKAIVAGFPFHLLHMWIRKYHAMGENCKCGEQAQYSLENYVDILDMAGINPSKSDFQGKLDAAWDKAVSEQRRGMYKKMLAFLVCQDCLLNILSMYGDDIGMVAAMPMILLGDIMSVIVGCTINSQDDSGLAFTASIRARMIEDVKAMLHSGRVVHIQPRGIA